MAVNLYELSTTGKVIELGCLQCGLHLFIDAAKIGAPMVTEFPALSQLLKCPQCKAVNAEPNYPIWARPDARPPKMGAG